MLWSNKGNFFLAFLLMITVVCFAGGCTGSSSSSETTPEKASLIGCVSSMDATALANAKVQLLAYSSDKKEEIYSIGRVMIGKFAVLTDEQKSVIKEMFTSKDMGDRTRVVTVYMPSSQDIDNMKALINADKTAILKSDITETQSADVVFYSVFKDAKGNVRSHAVLAYKLDAKFPASLDLQPSDPTSEDVNEGIEESKRTAEMMTPMQKLVANKRLNAQRYAAQLKTNDFSSKSHKMTAKATLATRFAALAKDIVLPEPACAADSDVDILEYATTYSGGIESTFTNLPGFYICVNTYLVSVHNFEGNEETGGQDVYLVTQDCNLNASFSSRAHWYEGSGYESQVAKANNDYHKYWPNGADCDEFYASKYEVSSVLIESQDITEGFICHKAEPESQNDKTTIQVSHGWNIGASTTCGTMNDNPNIGVTLSYGYHSNQSESYSTSDIGVKFDGKSKNLKWTYTVNKIPKRSSTWYELTYPADLAVSSYTPVHKFIWQMNTSDRTKYDSYKLRVVADVSGAYSKYSGSQNPEYYTMRPSLEGNIRIVNPPLFCLDKDYVEFTDSTKFDDKILVYSQGEWKIETSSADIPSWLTVQKSGDNKNLNISVKKNDTDGYRNAEVVIKRNATSATYDEAVDIRTIYISQSPNSK